jgi:hypothetical protein
MDRRKEAEEPVRAQLNFRRAKRHLTQSRPSVNKLVAQSNFSSRERYQWSFGRCCLRILQARIYNATNSLCLHYVVRVNWPRHKAVGDKPHSASGRSPKKETASPVFCNLQSCRTFATLAKHFLSCFHLVLSLQRTTAPYPLWSVHAPHPEMHASLFWDNGIVNSLKHKANVAGATFLKSTSGSKSCRFAVLVVSLRFLCSIAVCSDPCLQQTQDVFCNGSPLSPMLCVYHTTFTDSNPQ